jgi:type I restriction enzyme, S subunit
MERTKVFVDEYPWLGEIPSDWEIVTINSITKPLSIKNRPNESLLSLYRDYGVILKNSREDNHNRAGNDLSSYKYVSENNLVINKMKAWQGSVGISKYNGIISPAYIICKVKEGINTEYLNFILRCNYYKHQYGRLSYGVRTDQWDMRYNDFKKLPILLPSLDEQNKIANFIKFKLAKVNSFINKKKQLIKLLNEQKTGIINQAITKGIDPNAKMKPSGIEWLGDIPENWAIIRTKYLGKAIIGLTYSPTEETDSENGILVLRSSNVQNGQVAYDDCVYVTTYVPDNKITRVGDILICSRNGSIKLIGKNALIDEKASNQTFGAFMTIFRSPNFEYLHYFFNSSSFKAQSGLFFTSTINQLTTAVLNNIIVAIPKSIEEQNKIVDFIKAETNFINRTISTIVSEIELTEEYKTALIAEAVTGKIDVRDYKIPETLAEETYEELEEELSIAAESETEYEIEGMN